MRDTAERFAEYAALMADRLGDVVTQWITHNEPWVVAFLGHAEGVKAPGIRDWVTALRVSHHLLLSHGLAVRALRAGGGPDARVGITLNLAPVHAASDFGRRRGGGGAAGRPSEPLVPRPACCGASTRATWSSCSSAATARSTSSATATST